MEQHATLIGTTEQRSGGFTLVETLVATGILVAGTVVAATLFVNSIKTNATTRHRTAAAMLLSDKVEWLKADGLRVGEFSEYSTIASDGNIVNSPSDTSMPYVRLWQVSGTELKVLTVVVYANHSFIGERVELVRATTTVGPKW